MCCSKILLPSQRLIEGRKCSIRGVRLTKMLVVPAAHVPAREGTGLLCSGFMIMVASNCGCFLNVRLDLPRTPTPMGSVGSVSWS